jgi:hypothetical protein
VEGIADHDAGDSKPAGQAGEGTQVVARGAAAGALTFEREDGLGGESQLIGDSYADAAVADVKTEEAGLREGFQSLAPVSGSGFKHKGRCLPG